MDQKGEVIMSPLERTAKAPSNNCNLKLITQISGKTAIKRPYIFKLVSTGSCSQINIFYKST